MEQTTAGWSAGSMQDGRGGAKHDDDDDDDDGASVVNENRNEPDPDLITLQPLLDRDTNIGRCTVGGSKKWHVRNSFDIARS
jgi:hypothetical protein